MVRTIAEIETITMGSEAANLPLDTIFYVGTSVRDNGMMFFSKNRTDLMNRLAMTENREYLFDYRIQTISPDNLGVNPSALQMLHPELQKPSVKERLFGQKRIESHNPTRFSHCLVALIAPRNAAMSEVQLLVMKLKGVDENQWDKAIRKFADRLNKENREAIGSFGKTSPKTDDLRFAIRRKKTGVDLSIEEEGTTRFRLTDVTPFPSAGGRFCIAEEDGPSVHIPAPPSEETLRLRDQAKQVRLLIEEMMRSNGVDILVETLGQEFIEALRREQNVSELKSRIVVDQRFRILLPEYHLEISMRTLPKALYILFLRHPEGLFRDRLDEHKEELRCIYLTISSRENQKKMEHSIDELTAPMSDTLNQCISRINHAFREHLCTETAAGYVIDGPRGEKKRVAMAETAELPAELRMI